MMFDEPPRQRSEMDEWQYSNLIGWFRAIKWDLAAQSWMVTAIFLVIVIFPVLRHFGWLPAAFDYWR